MIEDKINKINPREFVEEDRDAVTASKQAFREQQIELEVISSWVSHPGTQFYRKRKMERLHEIEIKLHDDENLTDRERDRLFGEKRALRADIDDMSRNVTLAMQALEQSVDTFGERM
jgi:hypothetical protein